MYFNTTNETGKELHTAIKKASSQDKIIMELFTDRPTSMFIGDEVLKYSKLNKSTLLTSVRRSLTILSKPIEKGKKKRPALLRKTDTKKMGVYGVMCYCYRLKS